MLNKSLYAYTFALLLFIASCTKNDTSNSSGSSLNNIENTIKGKWFLKSKSDSVIINNRLSQPQTITYSSFQGIPYIELLTTKSPNGPTVFGGPNAKDLTDAGTNLGSTEYGPPIAITTKGYWYYDETMKMFIMGGFGLNILKSTSSELVLQFKYGEPSSLFYSFTWSYKR